MIIQQIQTSPDSSLYIVGFNVDSGELSFRTSRIPEHLQKEVIELKGEMVHITNYHFHRSYIDKFLIQNEEKVE